MELAIMVLGPTELHAIYHLSENDKVTLCGRDATKMVCLGTMDERDSGLATEIYTRRVEIRRCCALCHKALHRYVDIQDSGKEAGDA